MARSIGYGDGIIVMDLRIYHLLTFCFGDKLLNLSVLVFSVKWE
jgi:hypothetical protein